MISTRRECYIRTLFCAAIKQDSKIEGVIVSFYKLTSYKFSGLADSCKDHWSKVYLINKLGRVEISVLSLPSRVWSAIALCAAVRFY